MKIKRYVIATILTGIFVIFANSNVFATTKSELDRQLPQEVVTLLKQVEQYQDNKDYKTVLQIADDIITKYPNNDAVRINAYLAEVPAYIALYDNENAKRMIHEAYRLDNNYTVTAYYMGIYLKLEKKYAEAIPYFTKCIDEEKGEATASSYWQRGLCFERMGDYSTALKDHQKAISIKGGQYQYYFSEGYAYFMLKDYEAAVESFSKTIMHKPNHKRAYLFRAKCYRALGSEQQALQDENHAKTL